MTTIQPMSIAGETKGHDNHFRARMFAPDAGIPEDPATGSAVACLAGALIEFDEILDGLHTCRIEQGVEMGRPSLITLEIELRKGAICWRSHRRLCRPICQRDD